MDVPKDEKPEEEKCPFDLQLKDLSNSQFCFLYYSGLVHFTSIFSLPISFDIAYWISFVGVFLLYFNVVSSLVCLFIEYVFVFQPDNMENVETSILRWKSLIYKILLSIIVFLIDVWNPLQEWIIMQLLTKSANSER